MKKSALTRFLTLLISGAAGTGIATAAVAADVDTSAAAGVTEAHMSASGSANANAQWRNGATRGAERAVRRMSSYGAEMERSGKTGFDATGQTAHQGKR